MTKPQMHDLALLGAQARLQALEDERQALVAMFPELGRPARNATRPSADTSRRRAGMSPEQREAVSARMKAYWAARRAERAGGAEAGATGNGQPARKRAMRKGRRKR